MYFGMTQLLIIMSTCHIHYLDFIFMSFINGGQGRLAAVEAGDAGRR